MSFIFKFKSNNGVYTLFNGAYSFVIETSKYAIVDCAKLTDTDLLTLAQHVFIGEVITTNLINFYSYTQLKLLGQVISDITVEDVLTSNSVLNALSANQGKLLNDAIGLKLDASSYNDYYKGTYTTLGNLQAAIPTSTSGSYAIVDTGAGNDAKLYIWDTQDGWLEGGSTGAATTDALAEGLTNLYFTNGRAVSALTASLLSNLTPTVNTQPGPSYTVGTVGPITMARQS